MNTEIQNQEEFVQNWYETAEYMLTNDTKKLSKAEIDQLLADATYDMTDEEAENFLRSLGNIVSKGVKVIAPIAKSLAPVVGTVAGAAIGGPVGAQLGGALGGAIANIGNRPQQTPVSTAVQQPTQLTGQPPLSGGVLSPVQARQVNQSALIPTTTNQGTANHAPVANQLLMLINNPDFLIRLLQTVIPRNTRQRNSTRPSEELMQDIYTINQLTEELMNNSTKNYQHDGDGIEETHVDNLYYDENETQCGCAH